MKGVIFILLACLCWALDALFRYPLVKQGISTFSIVFLEHFVLSICCIPVVLSGLKKIGELRISDIFSFMMVGGVGSALATICFTESFKYLNPSLVIILQKFQPLVAITLAVILLKEKVSKHFLFWGLVCLAGGVLVSYPDLLKIAKLINQNSHRLVSDSAIKGYFLAMISIVGWAQATTFGKKLSLSGFNPQSIMAGRFISGFLTLCIWVPTYEQVFKIDFHNYLRLLAMVAISGALAMYLYYKGLSKIPAKLCALLEMFFPVFAVAVNWLFLDKHLGMIQLVGAAVLSIGSLVIQTKKY